MEKITKEELMKKLNLTEEELEKVAGGAINSNCYVTCLAANKDPMECKKRCSN